MNKIIAVDFDGTLCENKYPYIGEPIKKTIRTLIRERRDGAKLILWTCRRGTKLIAAIDWCRDRGILFDAINENLPEVISMFGGDTRKVHADAYWDDKAIQTRKPKKRRSLKKGLGCLVAVIIAPVLTFACAAASAWGDLRRGK